MSTQGPSLHKPIQSKMQFETSITTHLLQQNNKEINDNDFCLGQNIADKWVYAHLKKLLVYPIYLLFWAFLGRVSKQTLEYYL